MSVETSGGGGGDELGVRDERSRSAESSLVHSSQLRAHRQPRLVRSASCSARCLTSARRAVVSCCEQRRDRIGVVQELPAVADRGDRRCVLGRQRAGRRRGAADAGARSTRASRFSRCWSAARQRRGPREAGRGRRRPPGTAGCRRAPASASMWSVSGGSGSGGGPPARAGEVLEPLEQGRDLRAFLARSRRGCPAAVRRPFTASRWLTVGGSSSL